MEEEEELQTKEERKDEKGAYDSVKGEMNGKMKHKGVVANEQTKLHEVEVEIMYATSFQQVCI